MDIDRLYIVMKKIAVVAFLIALPLFATCFAAAYADNEPQLEQQATEAAENCAQQIKTSYRTLKDFVVDYDQGKKKLDTALAQIGTQIYDQAFNTPVPYLHGQTRLQYRDDLLSKITQYDSRIDKMINHANLDARAQAALPQVQQQAAQYAHLIKSMGTMPTLIPGAGHTSPISQAWAQQETDPATVLNKARELVADSDDEQAAQFQAERNKLQPLVEAIANEQQTVNDSILEMKLNAVGTYGECVGHKVACLSNTGSVVNSIVSFMNNEQANNRMKLSNLQARVTARRNANIAANYAQPNSAPQGSPSIIVTGGNSAVPSQYIPGPNGIGGKTIPGICSPPPQPVYAQPVQFSPIIYPMFGNPAGYRY